MNQHVVGALAAAAVALAGTAVRPLPHRPAQQVAKPATASPPQLRNRQRQRQRQRQRHAPPGLLARRADARAVVRGYPDALDAIVLAVRAGYLPATALQVVLPHVAPSIRVAFAEVVHRTQTGERFADALAALPTRLGPIAAPLSDSLAAADRDGLPLAPVLERLAEEARQRRRRHADALARQLPVRMSLPLVLCILPAFVFLAIVPLLLAALSSLNQ